MALDWNKPLQTADGRFGMLLPPDGLTKKRRVCVAQDGRRFAALNDAKGYTTWHYNEDGTLDAAPASATLVNIEAHSFRAAA